MRLFFITVALLISLMHVRAQTSQINDQIKKLMPQPLPPSPNVASLGKFEDYAVTYFNGLPDISIPIFEATSGSLKVPLTLKYHAAGIKRTDHASWVGAGWALEGGGRITRQVNGKPDEMDFYTASTTPMPTEIVACSNPGDLPYLREVAMGNLDTQPDIFSYSYPGKKGNFLLSSRGLQPPYLVPFEPIVVDVVNFNNFKITDDNGILYQYGTNSQGIVAGTEGTYTSAGSTQTSASTAWHLMQMTGPNSNDKITFDYQDLGTVSYDDINDVIQISDLCFSDGTQGPCPPSIAQGSNVGVGITTNPKGLHLVKFENGLIEFVMSPGFRKDEPNSRSLDMIKVYSVTSNVSKVIKVFKFNYSYFRNSTNTQDLILKLDNVQVLDSKNIVIQQYKFSYETDFLSWTDNLRSRDYWGYYNGENNSDLIVPQEIIVQPFLNSPAMQTRTIGTANRSSNITYLKEGVLKRIDYPTGGYTQFDYEVNRYEENNNAKYNASGLRVSKITSNDGSGGPSIIKSYKYGKDEAGYGIKNFRTNQFFGFSEQNIISTCCLSGGCPGGTAAGTTQFRSRSWASVSAYDIDGYSNAPVVYLYVTEYLLDEFGNTNGKTIYEFDNGSFSGTGVDLYVPFSNSYFRDSFAWKNGMLTRKTIIDKAGNTQNETFHSYSTFSSQSKFVGWAANYYNRYTLNLPCGSCDSQEVQYRYLSQSSGAKRLTDTKEYTYKSGDLSRYVLKQSTNTYDPSKLQVTQTVESQSNNEQYVTINRYPFQLTANTSSTGAAGAIHILNTKNVLTTPIETYTYLQNPDGSRQRVISAELTLYKQNSANSSQVVPDQIFLLESATELLTSNYKPVTVNPANHGLTIDSNLKHRITFTAYDGDGNVRSVTKNDEEIESYAYGYDNVMPIARIVKCGPTQFYFQNFEDLPTSTSIIRSSLSHTGDQYYNGDFMVSFSPPSNNNSYLIQYWYMDSNNQWHMVSKPYSGTSMVLAEGSAIDDVRVFPKEAQIATYTYNPLIGTTSKIDSNGNITFYDYDSFGRLKLVKDTDKNVVKAYDYQYKVKY